MGVLSRSMEDRGEISNDERDHAGRRQLWRNQRVAELSSGIAHEVRNPLNAIAIHLEVLSDKLRDVEGNLPSPVRPNLEAIRSQIHRLDGIIRQFSDFAQGRAPGPELPELLEGAVALCSFPMRRRGLEVELEPVPALLVGDGAALSLALVETLLLGIEAAEVGSKIRLVVEEGESEIRICYQSDNVGGELDQERLRWLGSLLHEQGGSLEAGAQPGTFAVLSVPVEDRST